MPRKYSNRRSKQRSRRSNGHRRSFRGTYRGPTTEAVTYAMSLGDGPVADTESLRHHIAQLDEAIRFFTLKAVDDFRLAKYALDQRQAELDTPYATYEARRDAAKEKYDQVKEELDSLASKFGLSEDIDTESPAALYSSKENLRKALSILVTKQEGPAQYRTISSRP